MLVNSNETILPALPFASKRLWLRAFVGAWRADWLERRRDWRVKLVMALGLILATCAAILTSLDLAQIRNARDAAASAEAQRWVHQGKKNPHAAAHYGLYVFKPLATLSAIDPGVESYVGSSIWLEAHKQNDMVYRPAADTAGSERQFRLTPSFVMQILAPAAMIFLGFGMFAAERERGMMPALRLSAAPLGAIAVARGTVLVCLGFLLSIPACVAIAAIKLSHGASEPFSDAGMRAMLFIVGYLVYLLVWAGLIVAVSAFAATLRTSLALLVALWAGLSLIIPRVSVELAQSVAPLPSMQAFRQAIDQELAMPDDPVEAEEYKQQLLKQYDVRDVKDLPVNWRGYSLMRGEEHGNKIFDRHYGQLFDSLLKQDQAMALGGWVSPTASISGLSSYLAGSDSGSHIEFVRRAEEHRRLMQAMLNGDVAQHLDSEGAPYTADEAMWRSIPPFEFYYAPLNWSSVWRYWGVPLLFTSFVTLILASCALRRLGTGSYK